MPRAAPAAAPERAADRIRADSLRYTERTVALLHRLLLEVIAERSPECLPVLTDQASITPDVRLRVLQADGIWFQLFNIAEQNAAVRRRRAIERELGAARCRARSRPRWRAPRKPGWTRPRWRRGWPRPASRRC